MTSEATATRPPQSEPGHSHLGLALVLISVAQLMVVLDSTIATIALPYIGKDLQISQANLAWIVTGYSLAFGGLLLLGGRLGDLYGRRRLFMVGVSVFAIASLLGGFAQNELMLLGSRGLQGLGAAIAAPTALALITTTFPAGPQRNRAFSVYAAMSGAGAAVGLILGGWLTGLHPHLLGTLVNGWRFTFLINVPIGLLAAAFAPRILAESERHPGELDLPGAFTVTLGLVGIVYGFTHAGDQRYGWGDVWTIVSLAAGVLLLATFIIIERHVKHPLMPFRILANRTRATSFAVMMLVPAAMFAMFYFLSLFVQNVLGWSPLKTGFAFLPFSLGIVVAATISSKLVAKVDPRWLAVVGTAMAGVALFGFSRMPYDQAVGQLGVNAHYLTNLLPFIILMSLGIGLTFVPLTLTAVHAVGQRDSGIGSGVLNAMQQVGAALGVAVLSTVAVHFTQVKAAALGAAAAAQSGGAAPDPGRLHALQAQIGKVAFTEGATHAFLTGAAMIWLGTLIALLFLNVKHEELATDGHEVETMLPDETVAVG
ncbi:MAG: MFS transporter [Nocardioidaceae bacterium]